jgi:hypothetical protein
VVSVTRLDGQANDGDRWFDLSGGRLDRVSGTCETILTPPPPSLEASELTAAPDTVVTGEAAVVTLTLADEAGEPLPLRGATVVFRVVAGVGRGPG